MTARGMNASTGTAIDGMNHIMQSIRDILTTRIGTRTMRRQYGSIVPELIDQPANPTTQLRLMGATTMALARWEPRVIIIKVGISLGMDGSAVVDLDGIRRDGPRAGNPFSGSVSL